MAHPFAEHRQSKVEKSRVAHITCGYATGGAVHPDEKQDKKLIDRMVKKSALSDSGDKAKKRADRPGRAKGGRVKAAKGKGTNVNVIIAGGGPHAGAMPPAGVGAPMAAPPMPPHPPIMPPAGMPPGGAPSMGGMPPMPAHKNGGRAYAKGGRVKGTKVYEEGVKAGTQVQHDPGKNDLAQLGRGKPITYKSGGKVEAPQGVSPATKLPGGAGGGEARLAKARMAK